MTTCPLCGREHDAAPRVCAACELPWRLWPAIAVLKARAAVSRLPGIAGMAEPLNAEQLRQKAREALANAQALLAHGVASVVGQGQG
jgi:hypothetical protein